MGVFALIKEDFSTVYNKDPASQSKVELLFSYPGVWALFWHRLSHPLCIKGFKRTARLLMALSHFLTHIENLRSFQYPPLIPIGFLFLCDLLPLLCYTYRG